ncbi:YusW family protein [Alkalicoccus saliphilus]|jgi:hypothetical protein|uniref:YusW-like protein n=1 Tax=Alkalicoccus saliphilus TaxID=200989 RepID=A0A2T4U1Z9_9BACI|nr:YusW family protein [Alkalicoccus saliphilus]PTL37429.1 hypothetical protein C6Y45_16510 [Alkalicoccus saliphilus]
MKKSAVPAAALLILTACGNNNENSTEEVREEPDVNMAENNVEYEEKADQDAESVFNQDIEYFNLDVVLMDESEWVFTYNPGEEGEMPDASVTGTDLELEDEEAVEEMENYLRTFYIDAASSQEEITYGIMETFDFNQDDVAFYRLSIDFPVQENVTDWVWEHGDDGGEESQEDGIDTNNLDDDLSGD